MFGLTLLHGCLLVMQSKSNVVGAENIENHIILVEYQKEKEKACIHMNCLEIFEHDINRKEWGI